MEDNQIIEVVCIKDIGIGIDYGGKFNYYGIPHFIVKGAYDVSDTSPFTVGKEFKIIVIEREEPRPNNKFYFELLDEELRPFATIYDTDLLNEHFISVGDYRDKRIDSILND